MEPVYVEKWVTFYRSSAGWGAWLWDAPQDHDRSFRIRIRVPDALLGEAETAAEVEPEAGQLGAAGGARRDLER